MPTVSVPGASVFRLPLGHETVAPPEVDVVDDPELELELPQADAVTASASAMSMRRGFLMAITRGGKGAGAGKSIPGAGRLTP